MLHHGTSRRLPLRALSLGASGVSNGACVLLTVSDAVWRFMQDNIITTTQRFGNSCLLRTTDNFNL